ncbi:histidine triad nucleotide-binding protein [Irregularibacter muris]|uniref:Histidine triad nucleotide-binding protein n=1 Tax=Irregularibacter muris TaxID=1796619 RepID=A0AAE3HDA2_9FIRM|nr:histidine triad nucleotide-binding protein [Irregularibacter muris]MCR1897851.1 histidine triad nucleotide-binding protein [Irregularibacter muris]
MKECLFCKIANKEIPSEFLYEDDKVVAFKDIDPQAPVHILIIPKAHYDSILDIVDKEGDLVGHIHKVATKLAKDWGVAEKGFRLVNNCGEDGGQSVKHLHYHLLGGRNLQWPPG